MFHARAVLCWALWYVVVCVVLCCVWSGVSSGWHSPSTMHKSSGSRSLHLTALEKRACYRAIEALHAAGAAKNAHSNAVFTPEVITGLLD